LRQNENVGADANAARKQPLLKPPLKLSLRQKLALKLNGYVYLRHERRPGWTGSLPIYLVKCGRHGLFEDYKHGFRQYFMCPKCQEEMFAGRERMREK
jgi:hypothetical protein